MKSLISFLKNQSGATAIEYGLIVAIISVAAIISSQMAGSQVVRSFDTVSNTLSSATR